MKAKQLKEVILKPLCTYKNAVLNRVIISTVSNSLKDVLRRINNEITFHCFFVYAISLWSWWWRFFRGGSGEVDQLNSSTIVGNWTVSEFYKDGAPKQWMASISPGPKFSGDGAALTFRDDVLII